MRSSARQYHRGVALLIYPIVGVIFVGTALVFFPHAIGDWSGASLLVHSAVPALILSFFLWRAWVEQNKWRKIAETLRGKASDGSPDVGDALLRSPAELLQKPAPHVSFVIWAAGNTWVVKYLLPALLGLVILMVAAYFNVFIETGGSTIVFVLAFSTMSVCIWLNWRAFPLIFLNGAALLAINFITIQANDVLRPAVDYFEGIISSGRL